MRATGANVCGALVWTGPAVKARCRKERVIEPAVLLAGASSISFVEFEAGEAEEARREAARIAVSRARTTAESIAEAAGGRLGDLVNMTVLPDYSTIVNASRFFQGAFMGQGVQLYPSQVTMKVQVQVSWVFEAR